MPSSSTKISPLSIKPASAESARGEEVSLSPAGETGRREGVSPVSLSPAAGERGRGEGDSPVSLSPASGERGRREGASRVSLSPAAGERGRGEGVSSRLRKNTSAARRDRLPSLLMMKG